MASLDTYITPHFKTMQKKKNPIHKALLISFFFYFVFLFL